MPRSPLNAAWRDGSWDKCKLAELVMPGRVKDLKVTPERDVQSSQTPGTDGPDLKDQGYKGAKVVLTLELYKAAMFEDLQVVCALLTPRQPGALAYPIPIEHPITDLFNVTQVYVESIDVGMPQDGKLEVVINMREWFPEKKKKKTQQSKEPKDGGAFGSSDVPPPDPANNGAKFP